MNLFISHRLFAMKQIQLDTNRKSRTKENVLKEARYYFCTSLVSSICFSFCIAEVLLSYHSVSRSVESLNYHSFL